MRPSSIPPLSAHPPSSSSSSHPPSAPMQQLPASLQYSTPIGTTTPYQQHHTQHHAPSLHHSTSAPISLPFTASAMLSASLSSGSSSPSIIAAASSTGANSATTPAASSLASRRGYHVSGPVQRLPGRGRDRGNESGMKNLGNSCYLSAVLQALLGTPSFVHDLIRAARILHPQQIQHKLEQAENTQPTSDSSLFPSSSTSSSPSPSTPFTRSFYRTLVSIAEQMKMSDHGVIDTEALKRLIETRSNKWSGFNQQDAHEFLNECLSQMDEDIHHVLRPNNNNQNSNQKPQQQQLPNNSVKRPSAPSSPPPLLSSMPASTHALLSEALAASASTLQLQADTISPVHHNFHMEIEQRLECIKCNYTRTKSEHFNDVSLDLPEAGSLSPIPSPFNSPAIESAPAPPVVQQPPPLALLAEPTVTSPLANNIVVDKDAFPRKRSSRLRTGSDSSPSPEPSLSLDMIPAPECTKHKIAMVPSVVQGADTAHFRCPHHRCMEERVLTQMDIATAVSIAIANAQAAKPPIAPVAPSSSLPPKDGKEKPAKNPNAVKKGHGGSYLASLNQLLAKFFSPHVIDYRCDRCDCDQLRKSYSFRQLPRVLILHVKRFQPNLLRGTYEKRSDRLRVDETLDLGFACTRNTRKPMPLEDSVNSRDPLSGTDSNRQSASSPTQDIADTFASLFATSAAAACKCGSAESCEHGQNVLTKPTEIAAFIAAQHQAAVTEGSPVPMPTSPTSTSQLNGSVASGMKNNNKRKSGEVSSKNANEFPEDAASKKKKNATKPNDQLSTVQSDASSYFLHHDSDELATLSSTISRLQGELRSVGQQMAELSSTPLAPAATSLAPQGLMGRANKREARMNALVHHLSEVETNLRAKMAEHAALLQQKRVNGHKASHLSPASPPTPLSSNTISSLGPGVVPTYELAAIIHHKGQIATSGHYITDLKLTSGADNLLAPTWKRYDDQFVRTLEPNLATQYGEREGYLFFYQYQPLINLQHMQEHQLREAAAEAARLAAEQEAAMVAAAHAQAQLHAKELAAAAAAAAAAAHVMTATTVSHAHLDVHMANAE